MQNNTPEQNLINSFVDALGKTDIEDIQLSKPSEPHNQNCKSRTLADIEFTSDSGIRWAIEAKSNESKDKYNTVHKFFGELLKETGRANRDNCNIGILIPRNSKGFYSKAFKKINKEKFIAFGDLIPVKQVFTYDEYAGIEMISWFDLYNYTSPE
jgi:hypothetical protein